MEEISRHHQQQRRFTCVLFDMDGTLMDSAPGVVASAAEALRAVGAVVPDVQTLRSFVGPPMYDSFRQVVGLDEETAGRALAAYRRSYADKGALNNSLYDGIVAMVAALNGGGLPLAVATSKVEDQAMRLAGHFRLDDHFVDVCGASDAEARRSKTDVISESLRRLAAQGVDVSCPVMVGDRCYDIEGAASHGVPAIHVQWGYGPAEAKGAVATVDSPAQLAALLLNHAPG
ncbi:HAD hydrolase-like protein [Pseudarthrobacter sp. P1]|uniref:HAD hydrolase-like protein n=1 Tax=Pseudarthrobacter sp. P1 TaxID=3418418 RepID=UPI003CF5283F